MKLIPYGGKEYRPVLCKDGRLDVRATVAYGLRDSGEFLLSVYVLCQPKGAGSRGGKTDLSMDVRVHRETVPNYMTTAEQQRRLEFALNILAVRMECDYRLRLPIATKLTPKQSTTRSMTWHSKT